MTKNAILGLFVCKWSNAHSKPQRFNTQEDLEFHVDNDHKELEAFNRRRQVYLCPWEGCEKQQKDTTELKEHLHKHTQQKPFKCPVCNDLRRFGSLYTLNQHLINNHNDSFVDSTDANDMTNIMNCDENEEQKIEKVNKNDNKFQKLYHFQPPQHGKSYADAAKLYLQRQDKVDVLAKEKVNKDEVDNDRYEFPEDYIKRYQNEQATEFFWKGMSYLAEDHGSEDDLSEYDFENENYDDLPDVPEIPKGMTEKEKEQEIWESLCERRKGSKAIEFLRKAYDILENGTEY